MINLQVNDQCRYRQYAQIRRIIPQAAQFDVNCRLTGQTRSDGSSEEGAMRPEIRQCKNADWWLCFWKSLGEIQLPLSSGRRWFKAHRGIDQDNICQLHCGRRFKIVFSNATTFPTGNLPLLVIPDNDPEKSWWHITTSTGELSFQR